MKKKSVVLLFVVLLLFLFTLPIDSLSNLFGPKIEAPVFVKSLIYEEDMDVDLYYIAPRGFNKSVEKVQILNAPKGIDCVVYGEEKEFGIKYTIGTVNMGVNCNNLNEETGIGEDLEINELLVTWSDDSQTTEDVGNIIVIGENIQCNNYMNTSMHDGIRKATCTLTKDTEITGLKFPFKNEMFNTISNITINDVPLDDVSIENPIKLTKNEMCIVEYQVNEESKSQYGIVSVAGFLMGKSNKNEEKIADVALYNNLGFNQGAGAYLKKLSAQNTTDNNFNKAINTFSYDTAQALLKDRTDNFNYCPLSLYYALALLGTGTGGETQQEIFELLGASTAEELSVQCKNLYKLLYTDNKISKLKIANSLWLSENIDFKDTFVSNAADYFHAATFSVDFSNKDTAKVMAKWISENTNGTLTPNLEINPYHILSIINTIYFYDEWVDGFNKNLTQEDIFYAENTEVKADFMNQTLGCSEFVKGYNFTRSSLNLKNDGEMTFILPDEGVSVSDLISSKHSLQALFEDGEINCGKVVWKIPKFEFGTECDLANILQTLSITNVFKSNADFSGITDGDAFINSVIQENHIGIDENGVEASAFTKIDLYGAVYLENKVEMILDRPFIYGITSSDGTLIFVGVCNNPSV